MTNKRLRPLQERFWEKVQKAKDGCWLWIAGVGGSGYGRIGRDGKNDEAHRVSWEMHFGPIPAGMFVCHRCDVRTCVNPGHLFLGNHNVNMADRKAKGRVPVGEQSGRSVLTEAAVRQIRAQHAAGATAVSLAARYGVARTTIGAVVRGKIWNHIKQDPSNT